MRTEHRKKIVYLVDMKQITLCALLFSLMIVFTACFDEDSASPAKSDENIDLYTDPDDKNNKDNDETVRKNDSTGKSIQELKRMFEDKSVSYSIRVDSSVNEAAGTIAFFVPTIQKMCVTQENERVFKNVVLEKDFVKSETSISKARYEVFNDTLILYGKMYMFTDYATQGDLYVSDHHDGIYGTWYSTGCSGGRHSKLYCNDDEDKSYTYLKLDIGKDYIEVDGRHVVGRLHKYCGGCNVPVSNSAFLGAFGKFMEDTISYSFEPSLVEGRLSDIPYWITYSILDSLVLFEYPERTVSIRQDIEVETRIKISLTVSSGDFNCHATTYMYDFERIPDEFCEESRPEEVSGIRKNVYTTDYYRFRSNGVWYNYVAELYYIPVDEKKEFNDCLEELRAAYKKEKKPSE